MRLHPPIFSDLSETFPNSRTLGQWNRFILYIKATKMAPRPIRPAEATCKLPDAADDELEALAEDVAVPDDAPFPVAVAPEPVPVAPDCTPVVTLIPVSTPEPPTTTVVELPTDTVNEVSEEEMFNTIAVSPVGNPAGIVASVG